MSSILSLMTRRQKLPNEVLTNVLITMDPWDVWPLRRVCQNFNNYILRYLGPREYLPMTTIFVRGEDSWVFVGANKDTVTPSPDSTGMPETSADDEAPAAHSPLSPFSSSLDHRGQKLTFLAMVTPPHRAPPLPGSNVSQPIAEFLPAVEAERDIIQMKLDDRVQIIIRVGRKYFRHVHLPSLVVDRTSLVMSLDWLELFNTVLNMPEPVRRLKDARAWPTKLWIPDAFHWIDRPDTPTEADSDADYVYYPPETPLVEGEEFEEVVSEGDLGEGDVTVGAMAPPAGDEPDALAELTEVTDTHEDAVAGFSRDETAGHVSFAGVSADMVGSLSYGEEFTTAEEALTEVFAPGYSLLLDYTESESSSEGGRFDDREHDDVPDVGVATARTTDVTSDEYVGRSSYELDTVAAPTSSPAPSTHPYAHPASMPSSELTPPSGSAGHHSLPEEEHPSPDPHAAGRSFLILEDSSLGNTSSDSAGASTYRNVGVQVYPFMLDTSDSGKISRQRSWP